MGSANSIGGLFSNLTENEAMTAILDFKMLPFSLFCIESARNLVYIGFSGLRIQWQRLFLHPTENEATAAIFDFRIVLFSIFSIESA